MDRSPVVRVDVMSDTVMPEGSWMRKVEGSKSIFFEVKEVLEGRVRRVRALGSMMEVGVWWGRGYFKGGSGGETSWANGLISRESYSWKGVGTVLE
jgi:hypothetical protein